MDKISIRLTKEDIITLEKLRIEMKVKSISDVIRKLIDNTREEKQNSDIDIELFSKIKNDCKLTLELLKQFYGEMSYKEYNPEARKSNKLKEFMDDYYHSETKLMK